jgi:hypothetical protein
MLWISFSNQAKFPIYQIEKVSGTCDSPVWHEVEFPGAGTINQSLLPTPSGIVRRASTFDGSLRDLGTNITRTFLRALVCAIMGSNAPTFTDAVQFPNLGADSFAATVTK